MEIQQRISEERFRQIAENSFDCIWEMDKTGLYTYCSCNILNLTGVPCKEIEGHNYFYDFLDPEIRESVKSSLFSIFERRESFRNANNCIHKDGRTVMIETVGSPVIDENGNLLGYRGASIDRTEHFKLIEKLKLSEKKFSTAFNNVPVMVTISELETGIYVDVNEQFVKVLGLNRKEIIGKTSLELGVVNDKDRLLIMKELSEKGHITDLEMKKQINNREVIGLFNAEKIEIDGKSYLLAMGLDITLRTEVESELKRNELLLRQLQMSPHFIFNAINSIQGYILKNDIDNALDYLSRFSRLIRTTLENSSKQHITLEEELAYLKNFIDIKAMRYGNLFTTTLVVDPKIDVESTLIPPMLIQPLIENAIKHGLYYNNQHGELHIGFHMKNDEVFQVIVHDNGIGRNRSIQSHETKGKSVELNALKILENRMKLLNDTNHTDLYNLTFFDLYDQSGEPAGTKVEVELPILQN